MRTIGGRSGFCGEGSTKGRTSPSTIAATGSILASILMRACACVAFVALARKRSTKACRCARCSSCFFFCFDSTACCSRALALEARVIAAPERKLGIIEMQNVVGDGIEQVAVMADDEDRRRIAGEIIDQPERAFEIEIIGRLVEQQQVGRRKQHRRERDAHPPAAGKFGQRTALRLVIEAKPARICAARAGAAWASISTSRVWISAMRCGSVAVSASANRARALDVGGEHEVEQGWSGRPAPPARHGRARICFGTEIVPESGVRSPAIILNSVVLPVPLRPTKPIRARSGSAAVALSKSTRGPRR